MFGRNVSVLLRRGCVAAIADSTPSYDADEKSQRYASASSELGLENSFIFLIQLVGFCTGPPWTIHDFI
jgi:hypothetical protein